MWPALAKRESRKVSLLSYGHGYPDQNSIKERERWMDMGKQQTVGQLILVEFSETILVLGSYMGILCIPLRFMDLD